MNKPPPIDDGSVAAKARLSVWQGVPGVVIKSPPGAGKTTLITQLLPELLTDAGLRIVVAAQTRAQAIDLANRLHAAGESSQYLVSSANKVKGSNGAVSLTRPRGLHPDVPLAGTLADTEKHPRRAVIANSARLRFSPENGDGHPFDVLCIDEAWQLTWAGLNELAWLASQILAVGDPGQIAPVVTADTGRWESSPHAPHKPGPDRLLALYPDDVVELALPSTHRCGPATAAVLQPLYDFGFDSVRPPTHIASTTGAVLPEISVVTTTAGSNADPNLFDVARDAVNELLGATFTRDGKTRTLTAADIAVGVTQNHQTVAMRSRLAGPSADVTVATINSLQGLQFAATVIVDPMAGEPVRTDSSGDTGRLCVALSRHTAHCRFITTDSAITVLRADTGSTIAAKGADVREALQQIGDVALGGAA